MKIIISLFNKLTDIVDILMRVIHSPFTPLLLLTFFRPAFRRRLIIYSTALQLQPDRRQSLELHENVVPTLFYPTSTTTTHRASTSVESRAPLSNEGDGAGAAHDEDGGPAALSQFGHVKLVNPNKRKESATSITSDDGSTGAMIYEK